MEMLRTPRRRLYPLLLAALVVAIGGCATAYDLGQAALQQGRYADAAGSFQTALTEDPNRTAALVGLGISRYAQGAYDDAVASLGQAVRQDPKHREAQLYLGLSYLGQGDEGAAAEHLRTFRKLTQSARVVSQVDNALELMRAEPSLSRESRRFVASSIESAVKAEQDLQDARWVYGQWPYYTDPSSYLWGLAW